MLPSLARSLSSISSSRLAPTTTFSRFFAVKTPKTEEEVTQILEQNQNKLVVLDYSATWCGPCKRIAPVFEAKSKEYPDVVFVKVDIDELPDFASAARVTAVPTFHFLKNKSVVAKFVGPDQQALASNLEKFK